MNKDYKISNLVYDFFKDYKLIIAFYVLFLSAYPIELIAQPHYYGKIIDGVSKVKNSEIFNSIKDQIFILVSLWLIGQVMYGTMDVLDGYIIPRIQSHIRENLIKDIVETFKNDYKELEIGDLISKIVKLPFTIRDLAHQMKNYILPTGIILIISMIYFFYINRNLGLIALCGIFIFIIVLLKRSGECIEKTSLKDEMHNELHEEISDTLNNLLPIYSCNMEKKEMKRLKCLDNNLNTKYSNGIFCSLKFKLTYASLYLLLIFSINGYALYLFSKKQIKLNYLISILIVVLYLVSLLSSTAGEIRDIMFNIGILKETQNYLNILIKKNQKWM